MPRVMAFPVYVINSGNINEILPKLKLAQWVIDEIINDVNAGYQVVIPGEEVVIGQWHGIGWTVLNSNGLGAYIISGGLYSNSTNATLLGGWGTEPMNTYNAAGNVGTNGGNMANWLDKGQVQKSPLDILMQILLPSLTVDDVISESAELPLGAGILLVRLAFLMFSEIAIEELWVFVALMAAFTPMVFLLMAAILIAVAVVLTVVIIDPEGEYIVARS